MGRSACILGKTAIGSIWAVSNKGYLFCNESEGSSVLLVQANHFQILLFCCIIHLSWTEGGRPVWAMALAQPWWFCSSMQHSAPFVSPHHGRSPLTGVCPRLWPMFCHYNSLHYHSFANTTALLGRTFCLNAMWSIIPWYHPLLPASSPELSHLTPPLTANSKASGTVEPPSLSLYSTTNSPVRH